MMTWSEGSDAPGIALPRGEKIIVLRFVDEPAQGLIEDWNTALHDRLTRLGNPVRVTFDCWRQLDGTFGFNIVEIGGEPFVSGISSVSTHSGVFSEGAARMNPLESAVPR